MSKALGKFLDGLNQMYLNSLYKLEVNLKRKLTDKEKDLVMDNFILRLTNHLTKKAEMKDKNINEYYLDMEI